jgi:hypothetical protein
VCHVPCHPPRLQSVRVKSIYMQQGVLRYGENRVHRLKVQRREMDKDSRYTQEASAPTVGLYQTCNVSDLIYATGRSGREASIEL